MKSQSFLRNLNEVTLKLQAGEKKLRKFHLKMNSLIVKLDQQTLNEEFNMNGKKNLNYKTKLFLCFRR